MDLDAIELPAQREARLKVRRGGHCTVMFGRRTTRQVKLADSSYSATDLKTLALLLVSSAAGSAVGFRRQRPLSRERMTVRIATEALWPFTSRSMDRPLFQPWPSWVDTSAADVHVHIAAL